MKLLGPVVFVLGLLLAFGRGLLARLMGRQRTPAPQTWLDPDKVVERAEGAKAEVTAQAEAEAAPHVEAAAQVEAEVESVSAAATRLARLAALRALAERVNR